MARTIWKYGVPMTDWFVLDMPASARILAVQTQGGEPRLWALVNEGAPLVRRRFEVFGTGHELDAELGPGTYVGTFQTGGGDFVWHLFDLGEEAP